jgi:chemotaxis protein methyltransferase CheR
MTTPMVEPAREVEDLEIELLLEGIWRRYGYDFREYDRGFIRQRVQSLLREGRLMTASQLLERVLRDPAALDAFLDHADDAADTFFKPARMWKALRRKAVPILRTYPSVRAWSLGGPSDGDLYALLILLDEELSRPYTLYATDLHDRRVGKARSAVFPREELPALEKSYSSSGGRGHLVDYLQTTNGKAAVVPGLRKHVVFASHNPATDGSFNQFQLILARHAMKGFNETLKARVMRLIHESLVRLGFLVLGVGGTLDGTPHGGCYRAVDRGSGLYQKMVE